MAHLPGFHSRQDYTKKNKKLLHQCIAGTTLHPKVPSLGQMLSRASYLLASAGGGYSSHSVFREAVVNYCFHHEKTITKLSSIASSRGTSDLANQFVKKIEPKTFPGQLNKVKKIGAIKIVSEVVVVVVIVVLVILFCR